MWAHYQSKQAAKKIFKQNVDILKLLLSNLAQLKLITLHINEIGSGILPCKLKIYFPT